MRQTHKAGEKLFVDYAGMTMPIVVDVNDRRSSYGAKFLVATFGASNYTFIEANHVASFARLDCIAC